MRRSAQIITTTIECPHCSTVLRISTPNDWTPGKEGQCYHCHEWLDIYLTLNPPPEPLDMDKVKKDTQAMLAENMLDDVSIL